MTKFIFVVLITLAFVATASAIRSERDQKRLRNTIRFSRCVLENCPIEYAGFRELELAGKEQCYVQCNPSDIDTNDRSIKLAERRLIRNCVTGCFRIDLQHFAEFAPFTQLRTCAEQKCPPIRGFPPSRRPREDSPDLDREPEEQPSNPRRGERPREEHPRRPRDEHPRRPREPAPNPEEDLDEVPSHPRRPRGERPRGERPRRPREEKPKEEEPSEDDLSLRMEEAPNPGQGMGFPDPPRGPRDNRENQFGPG